MNRAEKYLTVSLFVAVIGTLLFFSTLLYMDNYHVVSQIGMTVSVSLDGYYLAQQGILDDYSFYPSRSQFFGQSFNGANASQVIQWAIDNADANVLFKPGFYNLTNSISLNKNNSGLIGQPDYSAKFAVSPNCSSAFILNGPIYNVTIQYLYFD